MRIETETPDTDRTARSSAPGKIILSGEHAVVHGGPALVAAVYRRACVTVSGTVGAGLSFDLPDLGDSCECSFDDVRNVGSRVAERQAAFLAGRAVRSAVLEQPSELLQMCLLAYAHEDPGARTGAMRVEVASEIPVGRGMGSSAAVIVASLQALAVWHGHPMTRERVAALAHEVEAYQHGRPSGVDTQACTYGGAFRYRKGQDAVPLSLPHGAFYLIDTGAPVSPTGESVETVRRHFASDPIWSDFEEATFALEQALRGDRREAAMEAIRRNHELLVRIGVAPARVAAFIRDLEKQDCAAKICGAGAVRGDRAGMVLVYGSEPPGEVCSSYGYAWDPMELDTDGVTILD